MANAVRELYDKQRQAPWLDFIRRNMLNDGGLRRYVEEDGIRGVTANPTIFEKAIGAADDYDEQIAQLVREGVKPEEMFEHVAVTDISHAADILRPVYDSSGGSDGFVSIEVSPDKAFQTQATIEEVERWWRLIDRPNLMVKIPATDEGLPAIEQCIADGVNINITLIFAIEFHERVMEAYVRGLERRIEEGQDVRDSNSVASFFVSRVDTAVDKLLDAKIEAATSEAEREKLRSLLGKGAVANAKVAYRKFQGVFGSERFKKLQAKGAKVQRPLWASTGTKNAAYSDILYVQELIGPDTVNTMPPQTIDAFRDHGVVRRTVDERYEDAERVLADLAEVNISIKDVTDQLQQEGVESFSTSFRGISETTARKAAEIARKVSAA
ncbi:MAG: transaldolase [Dehalococcoidia bacterium]